MKTLSKGLFETPSKGLHEAQNKGICEVPKQGTYAMALSERFHEATK